MLNTTRIEAVERFDMTRTIGGRPGYWTAAYYIDGLLIDTGARHAAGELVRALDGRPLETIVNTHSHEDHIGANGRLQPYRHVLFGQPDGSRANPIDDGDVIETASYRFQILHTPGHSQDHLCLYEPDQGWLFSGDLFIGGQDTALRQSNDIWQIIASLKRVAGLGARMLFPGSARIKSDPEAELLAKIDYLEQTGHKVVTLHQRGIPSAVIARTLFGRARLEEWLTLGHFSRKHLVDSFLGKNQRHQEPLEGKERSNSCALNRLTSESAPPWR